MDPTTTTTTEAAPPPAQPEEKKGPGRKPLDPDARAAAAGRAVARKLAKKLSVAKSAEEFWSLADELAEKNGRKLKAKPEAAEETPAKPDPLDVPIAASWPTPRQIGEVQPIVAAALAMAGNALEATRYCQLSEVIKISTPDGASLEIPKAEIILKPAAACVALLTKGKAPDLHPGWALLGASLVVFGPPAASHAWEVFGPKVKAWWANDAKPAPAAPAEVKPSKRAPQLVKEGGAA